ncbi:MAG: hypothetical protein KJO24_04355 [Gammaproteobacteria bacterium]|nr:hypothetical protein [Gammaproteobacteria bacterium]
MIKKPASKSDIRAEIERQTQKFLQRGCAVDEIPKGVSSRDTAAGPFKAEQWHLEKSQTERTYLTDIVDNLESRKQQKSKVPASGDAKRRKRPRRRLIYDDFGEPLRWVWVDE